MDNSAPMLHVGGFPVEEPKDRERERIISEFKRDITRRAPELAASLALATAKAFANGDK